MKKASLSLFDHLLAYSPSTSKRKPYRTTQIVACITAAQTQDDVLAMIEAGMNIACFDGSKGKNDVQNIVPLIKKLNAAVDAYNGKRSKESEKQERQGIKTLTGECMKVHIATALDLKGSFIETGIFTAPCKFKTGDMVTVSCNEEDQKCNDKSVYIHCPELVNLQIDQIIIVDTKIKLQVKKINDETKTADCLVVKGGEVKPNDPLEVNIPGAKISLPGASEDFQSIVTFCKKQDIDMVFASVNCPDAFKIMKCVTTGTMPNKSLKMIAKLEARDAVECPDKIIAEADGAMISRGRLGRNTSPEQAIVYQKNILARCLRAGVPTIVAGDILKAAVEADGDATRAEIADVINSVLDGADCVMLDVKVSSDLNIQTLRNTVMEAEDMINYRSLNRELISHVPVPSSAIPMFNFTNTIAIAAATTSMVLGANAIIVLTESGQSPKMISKYRPECPIIAVARTPAVARQCLLSRGVFSIVSESTSEIYEKSVEERVNHGITFAKTCLLIKKYPGVVVAVMGSQDGAGKSDIIRVIPVEKDKKLSMSCDSGDFETAQED